VRRERERQSHCRRELRAEKTGSEDPHRHIQSCTRYRLHDLPTLDGLEIRQQFCHVGRKRVGGFRRPPERAGGGLIGARGPPHAEVDPAGKQRRQSAELLGDHERRMVRQHDPPAPTRIVEVPPATYAITTDVAALATPGRLWCSASQ